VKRGLNTQFGRNQFLVLRSCDKAPWRLRPRATFSFGFAASHAAITDVVRSSWSQTIRGTSSRMRAMNPAHHACILTISTWCYRPFVRILYEGPRPCMKPGVNHLSESLVILTQPHGGSKSWKRHGSSRPIVSMWGQTVSVTVVQTEVTTQNQTAGNRSRSKHGLCYIWKISTMGLAKMLISRGCLCKSITLSGIVISSVLGSLGGVGSAALWMLWNCRGCNCVIVLLVFPLSLWFWLEARGFFIDYSAGFRLRHSGGWGSLAYWQCQVSSQLRWLDAEGLWAPFFLTGEDREELKRKEAKEY